MESGEEAQTPGALRGEGSVRKQEHVSHITREIVIVDISREEFYLMR